MNVNFDNFIINGTISDLESNKQNLRECVTTVMEENIGSLTYILNATKEAWVTTGVDATTYAEAMQECIKRMENLKITLTNFISDIDEFIVSTETNKNTVYNGNN